MTPNRIHRANEVFNEWSPYVAFIFGILFLLFITGCGTADKNAPTKFENRPACSLDGSEAWIISKWWTFGLSWDIAHRDASKVCERVK